MKNIWYLVSGFLTSIVIVAIFYLAVSVDFHQLASDARNYVRNARAKVTSIRIEKKKNQKVLMELKKRQKIHAVLYSKEAKKGIILCEEIMKTEKNNMDVRVDLAEYYVFSGDYDKAHKLLDEAFKIDPDDTWALRTMGALMFKENKLKEAEKYYTRATRGTIVIDAAWAFLGLARIYDKMGDSKKVKESVAQALKLGGDDIYLKEQVTTFVKK